MLKILISALGIIVALIFGAISGEIGREVGKAIFAPAQLTAQEFEAKAIDGFEQAAKQLNAKTPTMIDEETRLDKATVGPGLLLNYHYTFPNYYAYEIDSGWITSDLQKSILEGVCSNQEMKPSLEYGGKYRYSYRGKNGKPIGSFVLSRRDCGFPSRVP